MKLDEHTQGVVLTYLAAMSQRFEWDRKHKSFSPKNKTWVEDVFWVVKAWTKIGLMSTGQSDYLGYACQKVLSSAIPKKERYTDSVSELSDDLKLFSDFVGKDGSDVTTTEHHFYLVDNAFLNFVSEQWNSMGPKSKMGVDLAHKLRAWQTRGKMSDADRDQDDQWKVFQMDRSI